MSLSTYVYKRPFLPIVTKELRQKNLLVILSRRN
jgi:hypothetical protein